MRRRGSVSFVVEVMRRRFPQNGATTSDIDRMSGSRISPIGAGGLSVTPLVAREGGGDPTIEAAKIAAKRFFSKPGSPQSTRADHWSDGGFIPGVEPARPADVAVQKPAGDLVASPPAQPDGQAEKYWYALARLAPRADHDDLIIVGQVDLLHRHLDASTSVLNGTSRCSSSIAWKDKPARKISARRDAVRRTLSRR